MLNIPIEYCFTFSDERNDIISRDPIITNRYWIKYPEEWLTTTMKERIIGFRSLFIKKNIRLFKFYLQLTKPHDAEWPSGTKVIGDRVLFFTDTQLDTDETLTPIDKLIQTGLANYFGDNNKHAILIKCGKMKRRLSDNIQEGDNWSLYDSDEDANSFTNEILGPNSTVQYGEDTFGFRFEINRLTNEDGRRIYFPEGTKMKILFKANDTKSLFNAYDYPDVMDSISGAEIIEFYDIYDRRSCMITSNIVDISNRYLGYTNLRYSPLKYYKINNSDTQFYIEFWNGRDDKLKSVFPYDNKEYMNIEMIILHDASNPYV
jgi:hypothetical protein